MGCEFALVIIVSSGLGQVDSTHRDLASAYAVSKTAVNAVTRMLATALKEDGVSVVATCPGHTRADTGGKEAPRSIKEGIDTPVRLATEAPVRMTGVFIKERRIQPW